MKNLKVSWKLFISYAVLLVLLVAGCAVSIAHLAGLGKQIETFYEGPFIVNDSANIVNSNFERMQKAVYRAIANSDPEITAGSYCQREGFGCDYTGTAASDKGTFPWG